MDNMPANDNYKKHNKANQKKSFRLIFDFVLVVLVILGGVMIWNLKSQNNNLNKIITSDNNNPQALVRKQTNQIISNVKSLYPKLPTNEVPTIATVTDVAAVQKQAAFFKSAQLGDKVLFYSKNGIVILYRPNQNKIINEGPLTFSK